MWLSLYGISKKDFCISIALLNWDDPQSIFKDGPFPASFFIFVVSNVQLVDKILPMSGFELRIFGAGSGRSTNCATTTAHPYYVINHWTRYEFLNPLWDWNLSQKQSEFTNNLPWAKNCQGPKVRLAKNTWRISWKKSALWSLESCLKRVGQWLYSFCIRAGYEPRNLINQLLILPGLPMQDFKRPCDSFFQWNVLFWECRAYQESPNNKRSTLDFSPKFT